MINSILLAEDNLEHCFFFKEALKQVAPDVQFTEVHDGDKLISFLENFLPDILFLDLAMPCKNGIQCIKEIRENRFYDSLPIVVFTISARNHTIQTAYGFGANLYFVKPEEYSQLVWSLKTILSIDWTNPKTISQRHFRDNRYVPFSSA